MGGNVCHKAHVPLVFGETNVKQGRTSCEDPFVNFNDHLYKRRGIGSLEEGKLERTEDRPAWVPEEATVAVRTRRLHERRVLEVTTFRPNGSGFIEQKNILGGGRGSMPSPQIVEMLLKEEYPSIDVHLIQG